MIPWYNVYSFWVFIFFTCKKVFNINSVSITPTVLGSLFGTIIFFILKIYFRVPMSLPFYISQILLHMLPLVLTPFQLKDYGLNLGIFVVYLLWLKSQNVDIFSMYNQIIHEDGRVTFTEYAHRRGIFVPGET